MKITIRNTTLKLNTLVIKETKGGGFLYSYARLSVWFSGLPESTFPCLPLSRVSSWHAYTHTHTHTHTRAHTHTHTEVFGAGKTTFLLKAVQPWTLLNTSTQVSGTTNPITKPYILRLVLPLRPLGRLGFPRWSWSQVHHHRLYAVVQEVGCIPGPVRTGAEFSPPPGFDPCTVQPIARRSPITLSRPILTIMLYAFLICLT